MHKIEQATVRLYSHIAFNTKVANTLCTLGPFVRSKTDSQNFHAS